MAKTTFTKSSGGMLPWLGLALLILIADQFVKVLIMGYYKLGDVPLNELLHVACGAVA